MESEGGGRCRETKERGSERDTQVYPCYQTPPLHISLCPFLAIATTCRENYHARDRSCSGEKAPDGCGEPRERSERAAPPTTMAGSMVWVT